jgi:uncharacterized protein
MRFTQDSAPSINLIRSHGNGELRIGNSSYRGAVIVSADKLVSLPDLHRVEQLMSLDPADILALEPELVLLGTGAVQVFPAPEFQARFLSVGVGFEVMNTGAACRTYNVLIAEQRRAVAVLLA